MLPDLKLTQTFIQVVETGSFTKAAAILNLSRAMISIQIKQLEEQLNVQLLVRSTRKIAVTEIGNRFYQRFKRIHASIEQTLDDIQLETQEITGRLRFTATQEFGERFILPLLSDFVQRYPKLSLEYKVNSTLNDLISDQLDLAIRLGNLPDSTLKARRLGSYAIYLIASPHFKELTTVGQVLAAPWIEHSLVDMHAWWLQHPSLAAENLHPKHIKASSNSISAIVQMVKAGLGISICPDWMVKEELEQGQLIRLLPEYQLPRQNIQLVFPNTDHIPLKTRVFIDYLKQNINL
ncbi:LysR substrate-binding domain-containing protein [Pseudomonas sp. F1_0610]|uniref:LysR family transcriptional regulator n=1 Tax=Pseudomonas sp. F1_0610 TaxID=3114284 RepID=UPI0039C18EAA